MNKHISSRQWPYRQRGLVTALAAAGMLAIIGIAGLALAAGDSVRYKATLQNALDAAVLNAARELYNNGATTLATSEGLATFNQHSDVNSATPVFEYSATLQPFTPGATETSAPPARFVRASVTGLSRPVWLESVLGITSRTVGGTAVAGPIPLDPAGQLCDVAPIMMCGDANASDTDCSDSSCWGYVGGNHEEELKTHAGTGNSNWAVGPGNYQLIQLSCGPGGQCVLDALAGGDQCLNGATSVTTKPGNTVGPVSHGFNTRFNMYQGPVSPAQYPPDTVITYDVNATTANPPTNTYWYSDYELAPDDLQPLSAGGIAVPKRRMLSVPIGDCTGTTNGQGQVPVLGFGCFYMTRPASHQGNDQSLFGQMVGSYECLGSGTAVITPPTGGVAPLHKIVLYNDPLRTDS